MLYSPPFLLALVSGWSVYAHMAITWPLPFRAEYNPNSVQATIDYSITSPLNADGSNFPCKGYQVDLGTPAGASVVTWSAGSSYNFSVGTGAIHGGGSCQASLSYDKGASFTVIHSYIGNCPSAFNEVLPFTVPSDAPAGAAMFAWTWFNMIGNREIYMDCASVTISGASGKRGTPSVAFSARPGIFVANLGNGCTTVEGKEVIFPNPGPDVTNAQTVTDDSGSFTGTCAAVKGIGGGSSGSGASNSIGSAASGATTVPASTALSSTPTTMATVYTAPTPSTAPASSPSVVATSPLSSTAPPATSPASASPTGSSTGSSGQLTVTEDGECSGTHTCEGSIHGPCCSQWGWCGSTSDYCGAGCQAGFGQCGSSIESISSATPVASPTGSQGDGQGNGVFASVKVY